MAASWYFERDMGTEINLYTAMTWAFFYHVGSLALGSFLIAILWLV